MKSDRPVRMIHALPIPSAITAVPRAGKLTVGEGVSRKTGRVNAILAGLSQRETPIYAGTVFGAEKAKRRARGKRQRLARKAARR